MGIDTRLLIGSKWSLKDVQDVLEYHQGIKTEIKSEVAISPNYFRLICENGRMINCHYNTFTPLGPAFLLSMASNPEGIVMLKGIAEVIGGYLNKEDTNEEYEFYTGMLYDEDGLSYHLKNAIIHNELADNDDLGGLLSSITAWNKKYKN